MKDMFAKARTVLDGGVKEVTDPKAGAGYNGIVRMAWCGDEKCAKPMEEGAGMAILGTSVALEGKKGKCVVCGKETGTWAHLATTY